MILNQILIKFYKTISVVEEVPTTETSNENQISQENSITEKSEFSDVQESEYFDYSTFAPIELKETTLIDKNSNYSLNQEIEEIYEITITGNEVTENFRTTNSNATENFPEIEVTTPSDPEIFNSSSSNMSPVANESSLLHLQSVIEAGVQDLLQKEEKLNKITKILKSEIFTEIRELGISEKIAKELTVIKQECRLLFPAKRLLESLGKSSNWTQNCDLVRNTPHESVCRKIVETEAEIKAINDDILIAFSSLSNDSSSQDCEQVENEMLRQGCNALNETSGYKSLRYQLELLLENPKDCEMVHGNGNDDLIDSLCENLNAKIQFADEIKSIKSLVEGGEVVQEILNLRNESQQKTSIILKIYQSIEVLDASFINDLNLEMKHDFVSILTGFLFGTDFRIFVIWCPLSSFSLLMLYDIFNTIPGPIFH